MTVDLVLPGVEARLECVAMTGTERVGEAASFEILVVAERALDVEKLVGAPCAVIVQTPHHGSRMIRGVAWSIRQTMTSYPENPRRRYRVDVRNAFAQMELRRRCNVFQHLTVPQIVENVLRTNGYHADDIVVHVSQKDHAAKRYVTQYDETDAAFLRRICEEDGLYFRSAVNEEREIFVLEDASPYAPAALEVPLQVVQDGNVPTPKLAAFDLREARARRPGKVTLRAYAPEKPALALEGVAAGGTHVERDVEVYRGAAAFETPEEGKRAAALRLESVRADATTLTFGTNAAALFAGAKVEIEDDDDKSAYFVVRIEHAWQRTADHYQARVTAIPLATRYRLPMLTPKPRAMGVHTAFVTGAPGEEIHTDELGRVFVHFPWDREGPNDHTSSLPVRVLQSSMPGSMIVPRVGWEVWVMFEDGDPDRPYVLGRTYNGLQPPPVSLPVNRTMTAIQTNSSPGAKAMNSITYDDAAGRQHFRIIAAKDKLLDVANDAHVNTAKVDNQVFGGNLTRSVGSDETVSVKQAFIAQMASQAASVGGSQKIYVKGNFMTNVKSETIGIGAALLEQVGNPVTGVTNLATAAALQGVGSLGKLGPYLSAAGGLALGAYQGYKQGGAKGAAQAFGMGVAGMGLGMVPGGDALMASVTDAASPAPWKDKDAPKGQQEAGGGAGGASADHGAAKGPGPGHKNQIVRGMMNELVGAAYTVASPGSIGWKTTGMSSFVIGASHTTKTRTFVQKVLGVSTETLGALHVKSDKDVVRVVTGPVTTNISGALKSKSTGPHNIKANGNLTIKVGGSMKMTGSVVAFVVGSSKVAASPGGVLIEASDITVTGDSKQSSDTAHR